MIFTNKKTEEERRAEYMRRYQLSKQKEISAGREGELYQRSLRNIQKKKKRRRIIRNIKQTLIYVGVFAILILIIVGLVLAVKQLFGGKAAPADNKATISISPVEVSDTPTPSPTPAVENNVILPSTTPLPTIPPTADYRDLIVIDPGHGGIDGGTDSNGVIEKDINLTISHKLKKSLEEYGYTVSMTREDDTYVKRMDRVNFANNLNGCAAFISIHCNAYENSDDVNGIEVWCYDRKESVELSESLLEQIVESTGGNNRGVNLATNLTVTRHTTMPACIVECGYLTSTKEHELLQNEEYQQRIVNGILVGLDLFLRDGGFNGNN